MARKTPSFDAHADPLGGAEPARFYMRMVATLEEILTADVLGDLFRAVRSAGLRDSLPLGDGEVARLFARLGLLPPGSTRETATKLAEDFVRAASVAVSRMPAQVSLVLRLFAAGQPGVMDKGVCGATPRCHQCGLTKDCRFFNEPARPLTEKIAPLKRLERDGMEALSDLEVLSLLLGGSRAADPDLARAQGLLNRYGTLRELMAAPYLELAGLRDVNASMAARLAAAAAYSRRALGERRIAGPKIRGAMDLYELFHPQLRDLRNEVVLLVMCDAANRVFRSIKVAEGGIASVQADPSVVFRPALREGAHGVAVLHNHPSGDTRPSEADRDLTRRLSAVAEAARIVFLDHVIVGEGAYTSFVDEGLLPPTAPEWD